MKRSPMSTRFRRLTGRARQEPERVNHLYRQRPDYREGPLNSMLVALLVVIVVGGAAVAIWGGRP